MATQVICIRCGWTDLSKLSIEDAVVHFTLVHFLESHNYFPVENRDYIVNIIPNVSYEAYIKFQSNKWTRGQFWRGYNY